MKRINKYGKGTFCLTNAVNTAANIYSGTVLLDTTYANLTSFGKGNDYWSSSMVNLNDQCCFVATGDPAVPRTAKMYYTVQNETFATLRAEKNQTFALMINPSAKPRACIVVEKDDSPLAQFDVWQKTSTHAYPDSMSYYFYEGRSWCKSAGNGADIFPVPDSVYVTTWAAATATNLVDVTTAAGSRPSRT